MQSAFLSVPTRWLSPRPHSLLPSSQAWRPCVPDTGTRKLELQQWRDREQNTDLLDQNCSGKQTSRWNRYMSFTAVAQLCKHKRLNEVCGTEWDGEQHLKMLTSREIHEGRRLQAAESSGVTFCLTSFESPLYFHSLDKDHKLNSFQWVRKSPLKWIIFSLWGFPLWIIPPQKQNLKNGIIIIIHQQEEDRIICVKAVDIQTDPKNLICMCILQGPKGIPRFDSRHQISESS